MSEWQDHYSVLQVGVDEEQANIRNAYKRLCKLFHPDVNPSPEALEMIQQINAAFEVLGNERSRRIYNIEWRRRHGGLRTSASSPGFQRPRAEYKPRPEPPKWSPPPRQDAKPKWEPPPKKETPWKASASQSEAKEYSSAAASKWGSPPKRESPKKEPSQREPSQKEPFQKESSHKEPFQWQPSAKTPPKWEPPFKQDIKWRPPFKQEPPKDEAAPEREARYKPPKGEPGPEPEMRREPASGAEKTGGETAEAGQFGGLGESEASKSVRDYFRAIADGQFEQAYEMVSSLDRKSFTKSGFIEWQETVAETYELQRFQVSLLRRRDSVRLEGSDTYKVEEYAVTVAERCKSDGSVNEYSFTKNVIFEDGGWKIYLGYKDLTPMSKRYRFASGSEAQAEILGHWERYKDTNDLDIGLPNMKGFEEKFRPEEYRFKRYGHTFSIGVFDVRMPDNAGDERNVTRILKYVGFVIKKCLRCLDSLAYLGDGKFGIIFAETDKTSSNYAARRILKIVKRDVGMCFDIAVGVKVGLSVYNGDKLDKHIRNCLRIINGSGK